MDTYHPSGKKRSWFLVGVALMVRTFAGSKENGVRGVGFVDADAPGGE